MNKINLNDVNPQVFLYERKKRNIDPNNKPGRKPLNGKRDIMFSCVLNEVEANGFNQLSQILNKTKTDILRENLHDLFKMYNIEG